MLSYRESVGSRTISTRVGTYFKSAWQGGGGCFEDQGGIELGCLIESFYFNYRDPIQPRVLQMAR